MQYRYWNPDDYKVKITMFHENVSDYKTRVWQKQGSSTNQFIRANKRRQNPSQQFDGSEDYDYVVDRKTGWKWYKEQQGDRILRLRRPHHGRIPHEKIGIHGGGILQNLTKSSE